MLYLIHIYIPGVGCKTIHRLLGQAGSAEEIYFLKKEQLEKLSGLSDRQVHAITDRKKNWDLEEKYAALGEKDVYKRQAWRRCRSLYKNLQHSVRHIL